MTWLVKYPMSSCTCFTSIPDGQGGREIITDLISDMRFWFRTRLNRSEWEFKLHDRIQDPYVVFTFKNKRDAIRFRVYWPWCYSD